MFAPPAHYLTQYVATAVKYPATLNDTQFEDTGFQIGVTNLTTEDFPALVGGSEFPYVGYGQVGGCSQW